MQYNLHNNHVGLNFFIEIHGEWHYNWRHLEKCVCVYIYVSISIEREEKEWTLKRRIFSYAHTHLFTVAERQALTAFS